LTGGRATEWLNRLEEERANLRYALRWTSRFDTQLGQRLVASLWRFWLLHGHISEGCEHLRIFLSKNFGNDKETRTKMLLGAGYLNRLRGDFGSARSYARESLALAKQTGDKKSSAFSLYQLGLLALDSDINEAADLFEKGLTFAKESEDRPVLAMLFNGLGELSRLREDYGRAGDFYQQALAINRETCDSARQVTNLVNLGATALAQGNGETAGLYYKDGLKISSKMGDMRGAIYCLEGVAGAYWGPRKPDRAALLLGAAEVLRKANNLPIEPADRSTYDQFSASVRGSLTEKIFVDLSERGRRMKFEEAVLLALSET
jgi:non-specific serine/threonine protein kinase